MIMHNIQNTEQNIKHELWLYKRLVEKALEGLDANNKDGLETARYNLEDLLARLYLELEATHE